MRETKSIPHKELSALQDLSPPPKKKKKKKKKKELSPPKKKEGLSGLSGQFQRNHQIVLTSKNRSVILTL